MGRHRVTSKAILSGTIFLEQILNEPSFTALF